MQAQILAPAAVLVAWTLIMLIWMACTRLPAIAKNEAVKNAPPGGRGSDLNAILPAKINWKAHNHDHLHEQPTLFYAVIAILAIMGPSALDVTLAWVYVGLRIVHSIWQSLVNTIPVRLSIFLISSAVLIALTVSAICATLFADPEAIPS